VRVGEERAPDLHEIGLSAADRAVGDGRLADTSGDRGPHIGFAPDALHHRRHEGRRTPGDRGVGVNTLWGAEFLAALNMRFASLVRGKLAQMEVSIGIIPGAGGTAYLPPLLGPGSRR
jgi:hypothetical protein